MSIINLTQHIATPDQANQGVVEPSDKKAVQELLTFTTCPNANEIKERAVKLAALCEGYETAMVGGAGYLMRPLVQELFKKNVQPVFAISKPVEKQETLPDGTIKTQRIFQHEGFLKPDKYMKPSNYTDNEIAAFVTHAEMAKDAIASYASDGMEDEGYGAWRSASELTSEAIASKKLHEPSNDKNDQIINLTAHPLTPEQIAAGVVEPEASVKAIIKECNNTCLENRYGYYDVNDQMEMHSSLKRSAVALATIAKDYKGAVIGGAPFFMPYLENALAVADVTPQYPFSQRVSQDKQLPDGTVEKTFLFKQTGTIDIPIPAKKTKNVSKPKGREM